MKIYGCMAVLLAVWCACGVVVPVGVEWHDPAEGRGMLEESIDDFHNILRRMEAPAAPEITIWVHPDWQGKSSDATINVEGRNIAIEAGTGLGASNALYQLLDRWGCRFVFPGALGECIPATADLTLADGIYPVTISFDTRVGAVGSGADFNLWRKRNLRGTLHWLTAQHYWFYALPPQEYFAEHPEYYALIGGKRVPTQLCVSNPEVRRLMAEAAVKRLKSTPGQDSFPMDPEDGFEHCQCENCEALDEPAVYYNGYKSVTNRVADFANSVARVLQTELPGKMVGFYAYASKKLPPSIALEDNIFVPVTRDSSCLLHLMPNDDCPSANHYWELLDAWLETKKERVAIYEYDPISWLGGLPCPIYLERAYALQLQHRKGVFGIVNDPGPHRDAANYVNRYLEIRLIADVSRHPEEELLSMCVALFGPEAGRWMNEYYLTLARVTENDLDIRFGIDGYEKIFTPEIVAESRRLLDAAKDAIGPDDVLGKRRLHMAELEQQYLEAFLRFHANLARKDLELSRRDIAAYRAAMAALAASPDANFADPKEAEQRIRNVEMKSFARVFFEELGFLRHWQIARPRENPRRDALLNAPVPVIADGRLEDAADFVSPDGQIRIREAWGTAMRPDTPYYTYAYTEFTVPEARQAQLRIDSFNPFKVWLNGREIFERKGIDEDCPDKRIVPVSLQSGVNTLAVLIDQHITSPVVNFGFWARITDGNGNPVVWQ